MTDHRWVGDIGRDVGQRVPTNAPAMLISTALGRVRATVTDLSQSGCRIDTAARCHVGDHFVLKVGDTGPKSVQVVRCEGRDVGLQFAVPLGWGAVMAIAFGEAAASAEGVARTNPVTSKLG